MVIEQVFRTVYLNLTNAETDPILQIVAKELTERTPARVITVNWLIGIRSSYRSLMRVTKPQSHGGEGETARMLATAPRLVRMDRARSYHPRPSAHPPIEADAMPYLGVVASAAIVHPTGCSTTRSGGSGAIPVLPREGRAKKYML